MAFPSNNILLLYLRRYATMYSRSLIIRDQRPHDHMIGRLAWSARAFRACVLRRSFGTCLAARVSQHVCLGTYIKARA